MTNTKIDLSKTIEQLEGNEWRVNSFSTPLIDKCHNYRQMPLKELSIEQLRLLINQTIALRFIVPVAIDILRVNILAEGDFYEGDLFTSVLRIDDKFNPKLKNSLETIIHRNRTVLEEKELL